ncbi:MAG TPA: hypothetical protein VGB56_04545, partial [Flavisolibacter sp.]
LRPVPQPFDIVMVSLPNHQGTTRSNSFMRPLVDISYSAIGPDNTTSVTAFNFFSSHPFQTQDATGCTTLKFNLT